MYLFGASGHAKVIIDILKVSGVEVEGIFDDDLSKQELWGIPVIGVTETYDPARGPAIIAIGSNAIRKDVVSRITGLYSTAIHSGAIISDSVTIGEGTVVMPAAVINADTQIGAHCIINTAASVDHDCKIKNFVHIAPHAALCGGVTVGEGTLIGAGATIAPNLAVGKWAVVGAGAVVISDVQDNTIVAGNPAKPIGSSSEH